MKQYDLVIRNASVIDGSGSSAMRLDVAVKENKIVFLGELTDASAIETIDGTGKILAPGFIDAHTHDDRAVIAYPDMTAKVSQGVTTVITGNCGISIAPLVGHKPIAPLNLLGEQNEWQFADFDAYAEKIDKHPSAVNSAMLLWPLDVACRGDGQS